MEKSDYGVGPHRTEKLEGVDQTYISPCCAECVYCYSQQKKYANTVSVNWEKALAACKMGSLTVRHKATRAFTVLDMTV